jgi:hypothetical protein
MAITPPDPRDTLTAALVNYQGTYHNHKEQLGYLAAAAYVGGAVLLFLGQNRWSSYPSWAKALLAVTGVAGLFYAYWQFRLRSMAADRIEGLLSRLGPEGPGIAEPGGAFQRWAAPGAVLLVMFLWGAAAFVRVVCGIGS